MKKSLQHLTFLMIAFLFITAVSAQGNRTSPATTAKGQIGDATITVHYSSPSVKGRKIWGELVPFGKVWRAGANEATTFETDKAITAEGKTLPAGKYSLFALPGENEWKIIFNSQTGQWGTNYDATKDVLAVTVKPVASSSMNERLTYQVTGNGLVLKWDQLEVPVSIK